MKLHVRNTVKRDIGNRITAPEFRKEGSKRIPLLGYGDEAANHQRVDCTKEIFRAAAGNNEVGEVPDGMDRLRDTKFVIHMDANGLAIGLDVIPARLYRSRVVPASQVDVKTLKLSWGDDGVVRLLQRPYNLKAEQVMRLIEDMDAFAATRKVLKKGQTFLGNKARVLEIVNGEIEIRLTSARGGGQPVYSEASEAEE
jgi:hypothetical protein